MSPTVGASWLALVVGIAAGAGAMLFWAAAQGPPASGPGPESQALPVGLVAPQGDWNSSDPEPDASGLRVVEIGSTTGAVAVGGMTELCARVVDGQGDPLPNATVTFSASAGNVPIPSVRSDALGIACAGYEAPGEVGTIAIEAFAREGDAVSSAARNFVEVVGHESHHPGEPEPATTPFPAAAMAVAVLVGTLRLLRRRQL